MKKNMNRIQQNSWRLFYQFLIINIMFGTMILNMMRCNDSKMFEKRFFIHISIPLMPPKLLKTLANSFLISFKVYFHSFIFLIKFKFIILFILILLLLLFIIINIIIIIISNIITIMINYY